MAQVAKVPYGVSLEVVFDEFSLTIGRLKADKYASALVASGEGFRKSFFNALSQEFGLRESLSAVQAAVLAQDDELNDVSDAVIETILSLSKNGYQDALYKHYCGDKRPNEFKRPILGEQLEAVRAWGHSMQNPSTEPALAALAGVVNAAVAGADKAIEARNKAQQDNADYRHIGERKKLIDDFNAWRAALATQLEEIRQKTTERKLPEEYVERFFRKAKSRSQAESKAETRKLEEEIAVLEQELSAKKVQLTELAAQEEERKRSEAELEATLVALAESQKLAEEAKRKADELRARLGKK